MTVINVDKDPAALTMTVTSEFAAPIERVWTVWSDPRLLERWWGPPSHPATVVDHDLTPGGRVTYFMTGPDGERFYGYWDVTAVEVPTSLDFDDGFADDDHQPDDSSPPIATAVRLSSTSTGTNMSITSTFASTESMEQVLAMGAEEGIVLALGQIDLLLGT